MSKVCIIIPCYNEFERLKVTDFLDFITQNNGLFSILFVDDGSSDSTLEKLRKIESRNSQLFDILSLQNNVGKAEAIRQGMLKAFATNKFSHLAYLDADLATPLSEIKLMYELMNHKKNLKLVLCSRIKRIGSNVERKVSRHYLGRVFATFASMILKIAVYDTQCGAKLMKSEIIPITLNQPFLTKWLFDIEIIARIRNKYPDQIESILYEFPVNEWKDVAGSKLKLRHMVQVPFDLWRIHRKYNK